MPRLSPASLPVRRPAHFAFASRFSVYLDGKRFHLAGNNLEPPGGVMRVCLLTDLHLQPPQTQALSSRLENVRHAVVACELVIYSGDILTMDACNGNLLACSSYYSLARFVVDTIAKPFMFTLGNHDGAPWVPPRQEVQRRLAASTHHVGQCDTSLNACVHPTLGIATLDSGKENCHSGTHWGCPLAAAASWLDATLATRSEQFGLLVTHIPPPNVLGLQVQGVVGENICCWDEFSADDTVLPSRRPLLHAFGHDHSNLFLSDAEPGSGVRCRATCLARCRCRSYRCTHYRSCCRSCRSHPSHG